MVDPQGEEQSVPVPAYSPLPARVEPRVGPAAGREAGGRDEPRLDAPHTQSDDPDPDSDALIDTIRARLTGRRRGAFRSCLAGRSPVAVSARVRRAAQARRGSDFEAPAAERSAAGSVARMPAPRHHHAPCSSHPSADARLVASSNVSNPRYRT